MVKNKNDTPTVTTYADYELIMPANRLRGAVSEAADGSDDPVARAEAALSQLTGEFSNWMDAECERLASARDAVRKAGFTAATREKLFHAAHDIKGEAATFGFPAVADTADSLCRLIEYSPDLARVPIELVDQHVDAVRAIIREYARDDVEEVSRALTAKLRAVTDEFLLSENKDRPDYIEMIRGPGLVPDDQAG